MSIDISLVQPKDQQYGPPKFLMVPLSLSSELHTSRQDVSRETKPIS
jgi:hypothetical protein